MSRTTKEQTTCLFFSLPLRHTDGGFCEDTAAHPVVLSSEARKGDPAVSHIQVTYSIGKGANGEVFMAKHTLAGRARADLCVKIQSNYSDELYICSRLKHPYITACWGSCLDPRGRYAMLMELGVTNLHKYLHTTQWPADCDMASVALTVGAHIGSALDYIHGMGIIHADLSTQNILVHATPCGQYSFKLCDFGMSLREAVGLPVKPVLVTATFRAPELFLNRPYSRKIDVWALGVVMLCVATRETLLLVPDSACYRKFMERYGWLDKSRLKIVYQDCVILWNVIKYLCPYVLDAPELFSEIHLGVDFYEELDRRQSIFEDTAQNYLPKKAKGADPDVLRYLTRLLSDYMLVFDPEARYDAEQLFREQLLCAVPAVLTPTEVSVKFHLSL